MVDHGAVDAAHTSDLQQLCVPCENSRALSVARGAFRGRTHAAVEVLHEGVLLVSRQAGDEVCYAGLGRLEDDEEHCG